VRVLQQEFYDSVGGALGRPKPMMDDLEAEMVYLLIREFKPGVLVEVGSGIGYSTAWIIHAINDNRKGTLYTFDLTDIATLTIPLDLKKDCWHFFCGNAKENLGELPEEINFLLIDAEHTKAFAEWYIKELFPRLASGAVVCVHDVFRKATPSEEGLEVLGWLIANGLDYFSVARAKHRPIFERVLKMRGKCGIGGWIHKRSLKNTMLLFQV